MHSADTNEDDPNTVKDADKTAVDDTSWSSAKIDDLLWMAYRPAPFKREFP